VYLSGRLRPLPDTAESSPSAARTGAAEAHSDQADPRSADRAPTGVGKGSQEIRPPVGALLSGYARATPLGTPRDTWLNLHGHLAAAVYLSHGIRVGNN
jgi:hypothetical protein